MIHGALSDLAVATVILFVVLDPVGVSPYFASIVGRMGGEERLRTVRLAILSALAMLVAFTVIGEALLSLLGVDINEFKIAAGLLLLVYAAADLFEAPIGYVRDHRAAESAAIFPLATPLLAGPGSVATILYLEDTFGLAVALGSLVINIMVAYPILRASTLLVDMMGRHGILLIGKFMSLIMVGFAISIIVEGVKAVLAAP